MPPSQEFKVGRHNIGYLDSDFLPRLGHLELRERSLPIFQKLPRYMTDAEIESELKPGICELGDILAFLNNAPEECKDGYANLFYTTSFVVYVFWDVVEWHVGAWRRAVGVWRAGGRVFSPATGPSGTPDSGSSDTLMLEKAIERVKKLEDLVERLRALLVI